VQTASDIDKWGGCVGVRLRTVCRTPPPAAAYASQVAGVLNATPRLDLISQLVLEVRVDVGAGVLQRFEIHQGLRRRLGHELRGLEPVTCRLTAGSSAN
jgi:hypothetical protein